MLVFEKTKLPGVVVVHNKSFADDRGYFAEVLRAEEFMQLSGGKPIVQINKSFSKKNVIRGIHLQNPYAQGKLVQVLAGTICDVAVDLRRSSPTFKQSVSVILHSETNDGLYIPEGFGHGFSVLSENALIMYSCTDGYHPEAEQCIVYNDPELNVDWKLDDPSQAILSPKDLKGVSFKDARLFD